MCRIICVALRPCMMRKKVKDLIKRSMRLAVAPRDVGFYLFHGLSWDSTLTLYGLPLVRQRTRGSITIGPGWTACSVARHNSIGVFQPVILQVTTPEGRIRIGAKRGHVGMHRLVSNLRGDRR